MAQKVTVDLTNKLIIAKAGVTGLDATIDLYSDLKEDWQTNAGGELAFEFPFGTTGGDPLPGGQNVGAYFFLRNDLGWRIRPDEADHELTISGNLYPTDSGLPMLVPTIGDYTVMIQIERSNLVSGIAQTAISGAVWSDQISAHQDDDGSIGQKVGRLLTKADYLGLK